MKVHELIEELQKYNPELPVVMQGDGKMLDKNPEVGVLCIIGTPWSWPTSLETEYGYLYRVTETHDDDVDAIYLCNRWEQLAKIQAQRNERKVQP